MNWTEYLRFAAALLFVLALLGLLAWAARRWGLGQGGATANRRGRRLAVIETLTLDHRRRLCLVRRDNREYLLLLGPERESVLEPALPAVAEPAPSLRMAQSP